MREYQSTSAACSEESIRVLEKNLQATEAQLKKTEVGFTAVLSSLGRSSCLRE